MNVTDVKKGVVYIGARKGTNFTETRHFVEFDRTEVIANIQKHPRIITEALETYSCEDGQRLSKTGATCCEI
jgi:hypothetical protein